jgi:hypothetical protein
VYRHTAFGLTLDVPFPCPELIRADSGIAPPDVRVRLGPVPRSLPSPTLAGPFFQRDAHRFLLRIPGNASFLVEDGTSITVEAPDGSPQHDALRPFLFDTVMASLLRQRGLCPLTGFAMADERGAVLVLKLRGVLGASSLAALLRSCGGRLLGDGYVALARDETSGVRALPGLGSQYLWEDAVEALGLERRSMTRVRPDAQLYRADGVAGHDPEPIPVRRVYVLRPGPAVAVRAVGQGGGTSLLWQTVHHGLLGEEDVLPVLRALAGQAAVHELTHVGGSWFVPDVADALLAHLAQ